MELFIVAVRADFHVRAVHHVVRVPVVVGVVPDEAVVRVPIAEHEKVATLADGEQEVGWHEAKRDSQRQGKEEFLAARPAPKAWKEIERHHGSVNNCTRIMNNNWARGVCCSVCGGLYQKISSGSAVFIAYIVQ